MGERIEIITGSIGVSNNRDAVFTISRCAAGIAVSVYDGIKGIGGIIHVLFPENRMDDQKAPAQYADTGIPLLLERLKETGANPAALKAKIAGGSQALTSGPLAAVGNRTLSAVKAQIEKAGLRMRGEDTGGTLAREIEFELVGGKLKIKYRGSDEVKEI